MRARYSGHFLGQCRRRGKDPDKLRDWTFAKKGTVEQYMRGGVVRWKVTLDNGWVVVLQPGAPGEVVFVTAWLNEGAIIMAHRTGRR